MKKTTLKNTLLSTIFFFLLSVPTFAQTGFEDDVDDQPDEEPQAPIDGYVAFALVAGCGMGYTLIRRQQQWK